VHNILPTYFFKHQHFQAQWLLSVPLALTFSNTAPGICGVNMILDANNDYFLKQHRPVDLCNGEVLCFLYGTDWILKYYLDQLRL
jgi:hypothetical protein